MLFIVVFSSTMNAFAHGENAFPKEESDANESAVIDQILLKKLNIQAAVVAALLLLALVFIAFAAGENSKNQTKKIIFWSMVLIIAFPTFFFVGTTLYTNLSSITKGPVHWHADFKIITCGEEIEARDVRGLSNKLGTNLLHEHEDRRIHIEGVVTKESDIALDKFFEVQGGKLSSNAFTIPTNKDLRTITNGDRCDGGKQGIWQVFLYTVDSGVAWQRQLNDFVHYVPSPHTTVPPGDCIIFEFGPEKERADQLCDSYQLEVNKGNLKVR